MKLFPLLFVLLSSCSILPPPMDPELVQHYVQQTSRLTGRTIYVTPRIYVIQKWSDFQKLTCGHNCGLGIAAAVYIPSEDEILINAEVIKTKDFDCYIVHEIVHASQYVEHRWGTRMEREYEAYVAQFMCMTDQVPVNAYDFALNSCDMAGGR